MVAKEKIMVPRAKTKQSSRVVLLTVKRAKPSSRVVLLTEEGGLSELEESTTRPAEPGEEEPEAASRRLSRTISCSVRDTAEGVGIEAQVPKEDMHPGACAASSGSTQTR